MPNGGQDLDKKCVNSPTQGPQGIQIQTTQELGFVLQFPVHFYTTEQEVSFN